MVILARTRTAPFPLNAIAVAQVIFNSITPVRVAKKHAVFFIQRVRVLKIQHATPRHNRKKKHFTQRYRQFGFRLRPNGTRTVTFR